MLCNFIFTEDKMISLGRITLFCEPIQTNEYFKISLKENKNLKTFNYKLNLGISQQIVKDITEYLDFYNQNSRQNSLRHDIVERKCLVLLKTQNICYSEAKEQVLAQISSLITDITLPENFEHSILCILNSLEKQKLTRSSISQEKEKLHESEIYKCYKEMKFKQEQQILEFRSTKF